MAWTPTPGTFEYGTEIGERRMDWEQPGFNWVGLKWQKEVEEMEREYAALTLAADEDVDEDRSDDIDWEAELDDMERDYLSLVIDTYHVDE